MGAPQPPLNPAFGVGQATHSVSYQKHTIYLSIRRRTLVDIGRAYVMSTCCLQLCLTCFYELSAKLCLITVYLSNRGSNLHIHSNHDIKNDQTMEATHAVQEVSVLKSLDV